MKKLIFPLVLLTLLFAGCAIKQTIPAQACTEEAKVCPDGSAVGRTQPNCEFAPCPSGNTTPAPQACTMEAKLCPDGSAVGRTGPNCEFALCPGTSSCSCPEGYRQDGESCTPECYYSTPKCLAPSIMCSKL